MEENIAYKKNILERGLNGWPMFLRSKDQRQFYVNEKWKMKTGENVVFKKTFFSEQKFEWSDNDFQEVKISTIEPTFKIRNS